MWPLRKPLILPLVTSDMKEVPTRRDNLVQNRIAVLIGVRQAVVWVFVRAQLSGCRETWSWGDKVA